MQARKSGAARIGRRIGITLFWCLAVFVIGASARSVLAQLYDWPITYEQARPETEVEALCAKEIPALQKSLLDQAGNSLRAPRDPAGQHRWLVAWDKRFAELRHGCGSLDDARRRLGTLRRNVESLLHDHTRNNLPLIERIDRALPRSSTRSLPKETSHDPG